MFYLLFKSLSYVIYTSRTLCMCSPSLYCDRLLDEFKCHIEELKQLDEKIQRKVEKLEHQCHREAKEFAHKVQDLQRSNQVCCVMTVNQ